MTNIPISERINWIGASESAALFGVSPYITKFELFHQKAGNIPGHDLDGQERIEAGRFLEPAIAAWAQHKWQWPLRNVGEYLPHPRVKGMGCSLDVETEDGAPVEIKNVDGLRFRQGEWESEGDILLDAPAHFLIQVQHQMACRPGADHGWLIACVGGNSLHKMRVERHDTMIARIEDEVADFWQSVREGREPKPDFQADAGALSALYNGDGDEVVDLRNNNRLPELCAEYMEAHEIEKGGKSRKSAALAEIKSLMGNARMAMIAGGYTVKAAHVPESTSTRKPHWRFSITAEKES
ncbi:YqaJ viral recombinase family protein [Fodinicurvata sediminis]|uniref:YqaJ viral recombinase family nuclease n=1 Tax=Fodinicurvata sediminis TaxID=1121832 RepID=UPI0003B3D913|nr:YqaJ viral recombinase family protein [Fodinicurvata sediminis]